MLEIGQPESGDVQRWLFKQAAEHAISEGAIALFNLAYVIEGVEMRKKAIVGE